MILAGISMGTTLIFVALSIFYYDYVDPVECEDFGNNTKQKDSLKPAPKQVQRIRYNSETSVKITSKGVRIRYNSEKSNHYTEFTNTADL